MNPNLRAALVAYREVIGDEQVVVEREVLTRYETATFHTDNKIVAVLRPSSVEQVQQCMAISTQYSVATYPISTGKNVGYGSRVPSADNCIILELKRLNRILEFNEDLAYVSLEPGVTQQQLYDFLKEKKSKLWMDATGSFLDHSIIGNIAERGFGHTPFADHFNNVGGMDVVLANGKLLHTGFGRFGNAKAAGVYRWGVGPYLDGLFAQSNLGIITRVTLWLMPAPEYCQNFFFSVEKSDDLSEVIELLRPLRLDGTIQSAMHIGNDYKVISSIRRYPWEESQGEVPLSKELMAKLAEKWDFGAWNASGSLYGSKQEVALARKRIKKHLQGRVKKLRFLDEGLLRLAEKLQKPYHWLTGVNLPEMLKLLKPIFGLTTGVPTGEMIASTYWRKKQAAPANPDPDRDRCGLMWLAPVAPTKGQYAQEIWSIVESTMLKYAFEPAVSITLITERAMDCVVSISYDRDVAGEDERAQSCHDEMLNKLTASGYYPYRLGIHSMGGLPASEDAYIELMTALNGVWNPNKIMAPSRYPFK